MPEFTEKARQAMQGRTGPRFTTIIPVYSGGENFRSCLDSIEHSDVASTEIIVVADGPSDGSWRLARDRGMHVIVLPENGGQSRARNRGAQAATGEILLFIDADVAVPPRLIEPLGAVFTQRPETAAVFGSYDDAPADPGFLSQYKNLFHHHTHQHAAADAWTFWTGCGAIRREVFQRMNGFDEARWSIMDIELGYRLGTAGYAIRLEKHIQVRHLKRWGFANFLRTEFFGRALPWAWLILERRRMSWDMNLKRSDFASVFCVYLLALSVIGAFFQGWWLLAAAVCAGTMLGLNAGLVRFFRQKRGPWFAARAAAVHGFYFFYCGLAFLTAAALHRVRPKSTAAYARVPAKDRVRHE